MTTFLQLHMLTSYPPACLNRDDLNRPKTADMGGVTRLRVSSQSLKRAWRSSDVFMEKLTGQTGIRSKELGRKIKQSLLSGMKLNTLLDDPALDIKTDDTVTDKQAAEWAWMIASVFVDAKGKGADDVEDAAVTEEKGKRGKKKNVNKDTLKCEQIVFYSRDEIASIDSLIKALRETRKAPSEKQLSSIMVQSAGHSADLALFGRMLASSPECNVEAACQVAHAITVHKVAVEDDFFTAVDDLNKREDTGSAHMGEQGFAAGLFYLYVCIDRDSLVKNLGGDSDLANKAIRAITEAAATVSPTGKQNSFGSRAWASYIMAEKGTRQPRSLSVAFLKPVKPGNMLEEAISSLENTCDNLDAVYFNGVKLPSEKINGLTGKGDLEKLLNFVAQ